MLTIYDNEISEKIPDLIHNKEQVFIVYIPELKSFCLCDSWLTDWLCIYNEESAAFASDGLFILSTSHIDFIKSFIKRIVKNGN